jgi:hypothetical protein
MQRLLSLITVLSLSILFPLAQLHSAHAQDQGKDLREATATAGEILDLAYQRKFNAMYDRIHPDAHAIIPRAAAVGVFQQAYGETNAGQATITDSQLVTWTWGVSGKSYDNAAKISFTQPYTDSNGQQQTLSDDMYLVKSDGEWRWFFGSSKAFVDQAIATYGPPPGKPLVEGDLIQNVMNDLNSFYADVLSYTDSTFVQPGFFYVETGTTKQTACGPARTGFWAFYCPGDSTIYVDGSLIESLQSSGDFAAAFVIAHEYAHHIQTLVGFDRVQSEPQAWNQVWSIELELMADCMAGSWALDVDTRGLLEPDDENEAIQFTIDKLGDPTYVSEYDPQAHGTADERVQAFTSGYEDGFLGCNIVM